MEVGEAVFGGIDLHIRLRVLFEALTFASDNEKSTKLLLGGEMALMGVGRGAAALVGLRVGDFTNQPAQVEVPCGEFLGEEFKQGGIRWRVVGVVQIQRLDDPFADEQEPHAVRDVFGK